jgi:predicted nucleic acid-binding protein
MRKILVDTNVILDIFTQDPLWFSWSNKQLESLSDSGQDLLINPIIFTEASIGFSSLGDFDRALDVFGFAYEELPQAALFSAGKAFLHYRASKGTKSHVLPDFFIGAHAESRGYKLLTRDSARYSTYFPKIQLIEP